MSIHNLAKIVTTILLCITLAAISSMELYAQPIPVGDLRDDQYRTLQLLSDSVASTSLSNRALWYSTYKNVFDASNSAPDTWWGKPYLQKEITSSLFNYDFKIGAYEPVVTNTYNSDLPFGKNNGAAWYGRGLNSELQGGFYATSEYFTITLRPHLIYTENKAFTPPRFTPRYRNGDIRYVNQGRFPEYKLGNRIDRPFRFGPDSYGTIDWGQSSLRLHYKSIETGISNETLWWGPGNQYALAMSNNAPGIPHAFIGTREPLALPYNIGDLEFRWIFARPSDSQFFDLDAYGADKPEERLRRLEILAKDRFMNGLNVVYSPSFVPNLSIGASRIIHQYIPDGGLTVGGDLLDIFKAYPKPRNEVLEDYRDDSHFEEKNPITSVFFRYVFSKSNAEFYGELYKGDHNVNIRDFLMEPQHGRAYTLGIQKIIEFDRALNFMKINTEINSLEQGPIDELRPQTFIYTHSTIKQGHTNRGQLLGAEIGPGSASQYLGIDGYFDKGKIGIFAQRAVINNHYHYETQDRYFPLGGFKNQIRHRIDLNIGLTGIYKTGPFIFNAKFTWNRNFNYGIYAKAYPAYYTFSVPIVDNFQSQLSIRYLF